MHMCRHTFIQLLAYCSPLLLNSKEMAKYHTQDVLLQTVPICNVDVHNMILAEIKQNAGLFDFTGAGQ